MSTRGTDLMNDINSGGFRVMTKPHLAEIRGQIVQAGAELLDVGARIRPLYVGGKKIGWVRGVHLTERKVLGRWLNEGITFYRRYSAVGCAEAINQA